MHKINIKKPVKQIDISTNKTIHIYSDAGNASASNNWGHSGQVNISRICNDKTGRYKTYKGYKWEFVDKYEMKENA